ncbi:uncharacterized protein L969DRAFT_94523 [Mixia osmundae IAM 14324]|uniref:Cytochrome b mRNA-processing protein 4 n=1 Tax=Mixia osmundae (strain CBS 9802 / IAM 14324 / JCM 22182 / KY 12970) TaxID=764103 RepID=G7E0R9_MIXOS|nr:uncharacterized protein L969DRAFT_94523 [Mixia osmundae IAM 14324]KEI39462.1 hypothetical protein L969DRAFT_94523 [Mixia osmundae IAM 14324]GAA96429.1 hypothetical protein E5Q_03096 [Mixia osmundae IAM 14324]
MASKSPTTLLIFGAGIMGLGYAVMKLTTPTADQFYDRLAPDLKRKVDEQRALAAAENARKSTLDKIKQSANEEKPIWAQDPPGGRSH